jgi:tRNA G10  N-methylase Trm11
LRPIETDAALVLPQSLVMARRYKGKTNELFTAFLCNVARFSSALARRPWDTLRVLDPLAGGGTTLFCALTLGASAAGVEHDERDVESTVAFVREFARENGIACRERQERVKGVGRRWSFAIGKEHVQQCILACGDTADSPALVSGFRPHLIAADLPYGIQHHGELASLLSRALPRWASLLPPSGAMAMAWESTRFGRADMITLVESVSPLTVLDDPPYDALAHRVDRVIKRRDVLVTRLSRAVGAEVHGCLQP